MASETVTDASFDNDVLKASEPVVVDFWAEWCGPCKMIGPALEEISAEMNGKVKIAKLNVDENQKTALKYGVRSIPTLIMFKDGQLLSTQIGAKPKGQLLEWINTSISA
jgi:thioredoxin 1